MMICEVVKAVALHLEAVVGGLKNPTNCFEGFASYQVGYSP